MNTNDRKMIEQQFTFLATKQKGRADMKIRQLASQQNAPTLLCGVRRQHFPRGSGRKPTGFYLPGKRRSADKCKMRRRWWCEEKDRELERVEDNDERALLASRRQ